jgi:uncharacterized protein YqcC (DUF446 family)
MAAHNSTIMSIDVRDTLTQLLLEIETDLRLFDHWSFEPPSSQALASDLPFCCDTLEVVEWLQFIFIPKMKLIVETQAELPNNCGIAPYFEQSMQSEENNTDILLALLHQVDNILT